MDRHSPVWTAAVLSSRDGDDELDLLGRGIVPAVADPELSCLASESLWSPPSRLAGMGLGVVRMRPLMVAWPDVMMAPPWRDGGRGSAIRLLAIFSL